LCRKFTFDPFRITGIVHDGVDDSIRFHAGLVASEKGETGVRLIDRVEVFPLKILDQLDGQDFIPGDNGFQHTLLPDGFHQGLEGFSLPINPLAEFFLDRCDKTI
jgi:hypothetical protein